MSLINFKIITPEKVTYEADDVRRVTIPTADGEITVLPNHMPLVSLLVPGELRIQKKEQTILMAVSTGFVEIRQHSEIYILADTAERAEEIDQQRAEAARQRVQTMLAEKQNQADIDYARLQATLNRELARLKVAEKYHRRRSI